LYALAEGRNSTERWNFFLSRSFYIILWDVVVFRLITTNKQTRGESVNTVFTLFEFNGYRDVHPYVSYFFGGDVASSNIILFFFSTRLYLLSSVNQNVFKIVDNVCFDIIFVLRFYHLAPSSFRRGRKCFVFKNKYHIPSCRIENGRKTKTKKGAARR